MCLALSHDWIYQTHPDTGAFANKSSWFYLVAWPSKSIYTLYPDHLCNLYLSHLSSNKFLRYPSLTKMHPARRHYEKKLPRQSSYLTCEKISSILGKILYEMQTKKCEKRSTKNAYFGGLCDNISDEFLQHSETGRFFLLS